MSEKLPTLAAVIANYNYARFLPDALDSVLAQQPPFTEIIVVDDGSTDDSVQVLKAYENRVRIILQENGGQIAACIAGMQASNCDYVYFLDADDYVAPNFTATLLPQLASHPVKVQFQLEGVNGDKQPLGSIFPAFPDGYDSNRMRIDNKQIGFYQCPPTSGNVFHRDTFDSLKFDETTEPPYIDAAGPLLMPYLGDVVTVPERLAFYRVHGTNMACTDWSRPKAETLFTEIEVFRKTWNTVLTRLGYERPPFGDRDPLYVLERKLMIAALENRLWLFGRVAAYLRRLLATELPLRAKILLSGWSLLFVIPARGLRGALVEQRRSPACRSRLLKSLVNRILHAGNLLPQSRATDPADQARGESGSQWPISSNNSHSS